MPINKILVKNVTPIRDANTVISPIKKETQLLFIIPSYEASYKGLDFVLKLSQFIPEDYKIVIVGGIIPIEKIKDIEVFAFDKTGTLTEGKLKIFDIFGNETIEMREIKIN